MAAIPMSELSETLPTALALPPRLRGRIPRWGLIAAEFSVMQLAVQLFTAAAGLVIVRSLSKQEYALFAIANAMQTTCNLLADCGIGIGIRSIGGKVWDDRSRFGALLNTAVSLRRRFAVISLSAVVPLAAWLLWSNGADPLQAALLCGTIVIGVIPLLGSSVWLVSAQLHQDFRRIQGLDLGSAVLRVGLIGALAATRLNALLAALVGVVSNWLQARFLRVWAHQRADATAPANPSDRRALIALSRRWFANILFFCCQGQITILLLSFFGNTANIADITALGRLTALFAVFSATFTNVFAPRFARCQDPALLPRLYGAFIGATLVILLPLYVVFKVYPDPFLWLLGEQYRALASECSLVVAAACLSQLGAVMVALNTSKEWIGYQSVAYIPAVLASQCLAAFYFDLQDFHQVLLFNLVTAAAPLPIYFCDAARGLRSATLVR